MNLERMLAKYQAQQWRIDDLDWSALPRAMPAEEEPLEEMAQEALALNREEPRAADRASAERAWLASKPSGRPV